MHGDNPDPNHVISVIDLMWRTRAIDIDISPLESPHTLRFGADDMLYVCCENSGVVAVLDPVANNVVADIPTGSSNTHRLTILKSATDECWGPHPTLILTQT